MRRRPSFAGTVLFQPTGSASLIIEAIAGRKEDQELEVARRFLASLGKPTNTLVANPRQNDLADCFFSDGDRWISLQLAEVLHDEHLRTEVHREQLIEGLWKSSPDLCLALAGCAILFEFTSTEHDATEEEESATVDFLRGELLEAAPKLRTGLAIQSFFPPEHRGIHVVVRRFEPAVESSYFHWMSCGGYRSAGRKDRIASILARKLDRYTNRGRDAAVWLVLHTTSVSCSGTEYANAARVVRERISESPFERVYFHHALTIGNSMTYLFGDDDEGTIEKLGDVKDPVTGRSVSFSWPAASLAPMNMGDPRWRRHKVTTALLGPEGATGPTGAMSG